MKTTKTRQAMIPQLLSPTELAATMCVSPRTIRRMTLSGQIPVVQVGPRRPRYVLADVIAALSENAPVEEAN